MKKTHQPRGPASLLWESLQTESGVERAETPRPGTPPTATCRLPYDRRCLAKTRSGRRCRGTIREGSDFCIFHDPELAEVRRQRQLAAKAARKRNDISNLPDGYLRKLSSRRAVGQAMDRLYREIRLERMTVEMGKVLFDILTRLMDAGLCEDGKEPQSWKRTKAKRMRPRLAELLTDAEKAAWRRAINAAQAAPARRADMPIKPGVRGDGQRGGTSQRSTLTIAS
ncbi:MAG: hypothetical protein J5J06_17365 [Phycisphaerae bacterium]|nr:hypothetical protein [Phycisphaerae bacterium]